MAESKKAIEGDDVKAPIHVLLIDDEAETLLPPLAQRMAPLGFVISKKVTEPAKAASVIREANPDVVLLDLHFPDDDQRRDGRTTGGVLHDTIRREFRKMPVVVLTTRIDDNTVPLENFSEQPHGIFAKNDYRERPEALGKMLRDAIIKAKFASDPDAAGLGFVVGKTKKMLEVATLILTAASNTMNVLIFGETGTGKELVAKAIHKLSGRKDKIEKVNCSGIPENILESDIFGHEKGAFTGAINSRQGFLELADKGTLFLDEVQGMPISLQNKLIQVIVDKEFRRMGGTRKLESDFRLVAATNKDLSELVASGQLREDLAFRLRRFPISLPPLRDRLEDLPALVDLFLEKANLETGKDIKDARPETLEKLQRHHWPGNIRELENIIFRAVAITTASILLPDDIKFENIVPPSGNESAASGSSVTLPSNPTIPEANIPANGEVLASSMTDTLESLPLTERYNFLKEQLKGKELRRQVLTELTRRLHERTGKKVTHWALAEAIDPLTNRDQDGERIRQLVCGCMSLSKLEWNK